MECMENVGELKQSYRNVEHDFKPRTTTRNYNIRLFYFLFSTCLFNLWVLVNICVGLAIHGRIKDKPIITAKMFAILLYRVQIGYFDSGG
jgi:IS4 transposase